MGIPNGERRRLVLLVEDDVNLRTVTRRLLAKRGFDLIEAGSAAEAYEVVEAHEGPLDAILMDINLPDGWGATVAQRLRLERPEAVIVYTTGFAKSDPVLDAALADAEWVIRKPYRGDELAELLTRAIEEG